MNNNIFQSIPELYRRQSMLELFQINTFKGCWKVWKSDIIKLLGANFDAVDLLRLGDHLSDIFRQTGVEGRDQGELSAGGTAWESLICWYINICTAGSRTVAFKKMSLVPQAIQDAITVNYANFACNTESDITVITFPNLPEYANPLDISIYNNWKKLNEHGNTLVRRDFEKMEIGIIQCKTNWNDNSQIPMLWDMIYSANGFRGRNITIGRNGFNIHDAANFTYAFVTVPLESTNTYTAESLFVKYVDTISGGNYWGQPSKKYVASSISNIFTANYKSGFYNSIRTDLRSVLPALMGGELGYFWGEGDIT